MSPMLFSDSGILTFVRFSHFAKASFPILVTEFGMVTEVNIAPSNALSPILLTELGIVTDLMPVPAKALPAMLCVPSLITIVSCQLSQA